MPLGLPARVEDWFLNAIAEPPGVPEIGGTARYTLETCLDFVRKSIPDFENRIRGRCVVDYGCGFGWQAVAMASSCGAKQVVALDIVTTHFDVGRRLAEEHGCADRVLFTDRVPDGFSADVVLSLSAFEHYADPGGELQRMASLVRSDGVILLAFAEPWYSPNGSHVNQFTRFPFSQQSFPWLNLFVSEKAMLRLRSRYRPDRPERLEDISGGLNKMTLAKFERLLRDSGLIVEDLTYLGIKGVHS